MSTIEARIEAKSPAHITRSPTGQAYGELLFAFRHFNKVLFRGKLRDCMITLHRHKKYVGYHWADRYISKAKTTKDSKVIDEIAMNPDHLINRSDKEAFSTLAHEMAHLWQAQYGKPSRNGYHNTEWGTKMDEIGLTPMAIGKDGQPNGKRTGQLVTHKIVKDGPFDKACSELLTKGLKISWGSMPIAPKVRKPKEEDGGDEDEATESKSGKRAKYICGECKAAVWGKSGLNISCNDCDTEMVEQGNGGDDAD